MKFIKAAAAGALALSTLIAAPASATVVLSGTGLTTYDSLTTFETPSLGNNAAVTTQFAGLTFAATNGGAVRYNSCGNGYWNNYTGLSGSTLNTYGPSCTTNGTNDSFTLTFNTAVSAVSMGMFAAGTGGRTFQTYMGNTLMETYTNNNTINSYITFSGYTFDSIRFTEGSASNYLVIDNLARVNAVPEPAALAFLGLGVMGLAVRRRRKAA